MASPNSAQSEPNKKDIDLSSFGNESFERLQLPILHSNTEDLYKEDKEKGFLEVFSNSEFESKGSSSDIVYQTDAPSLLSHGIKVCSFDSESDCTESNDQCRKMNSALTENQLKTNFPIFSQESPNTAASELDLEYGFHNDKPLLFGASTVNQVNLAHSPSTHKSLSNDTSIMMTKTTEERLQNTSALSSIMQYDSSDED